MLRYVIFRKQEKRLIDNNKREVNKKKKVVVCGASGSGNLGDSVIAECISGFIQKEFRHEVVICDISYRDGIKISAIKGKGLNYFNRLPRFLRQSFVLIAFTLKFFLQGRKYLLNKMKDADLVIVGGGQLISDVDLNFPLKLSFVVKIAETLNSPIQIVSAGVANRWSTIGVFFDVAFN